MRGAADAARQAARHRRHLRRPRDEGGRDRRPARARAHRRHRALLRGRSAFELPARARDQESLRRRQRARRVRDDRARPEGRRQSVGAVPVAARASRSPGRRSSRRSKARGRCWSRSRRWSIRCRAAMPQRLAVGLDPQRLALLLAVLHRHGGVETGGYDVFVNAVGGVRIQRAGRRPRDPARRPFVVEKQAVAGENSCLRRSRAGRRNPAGAARSGAHPRSGEARLHDGADAQRPTSRSRASTT